MFRRVLPDEVGGIELCANPWQHVPDECGVEWDRDVAPYLETMPESTRIYFDAKTIAGHLYVAVGFAVEINRHVAFKSVLWTRPDGKWPGGWMSNYGKPSVAAELDWSDHPGLRKDTGP